MLELLHGDRRERVQLRPEVAQRTQQLVGAVLAEQRRGLDDDEGTAAERLRDVRDRREMQEASDRRDLVGDRVDPTPPRAQHFRSALEREEEDTGVDLAYGVELELQRGHDAERPTAAAKCPEQV